MTRQSQEPRHSIGADVKERPLIPVGALSALDWIAIVLNGVVASVLLVIPFVVTPRFVAMYADFGGPTLPTSTRLVTSPWFPAIGAVASLCLCVTALLPGRDSLLRRRLMIAGAFLLGGSWLGLYLGGVYAPVFELAEAVAAEP